MGADQTLELAEQVVDQLRPQDLERREASEFAAQFVALRGRLDGTGQIHGDLDSVAFTDIAARGPQHTQLLSTAAG